MPVRLVSDVGRSTGVMGGGDGSGGEAGSSPSASDRDRETAGRSGGEEFAMIEGTDEARDGTTGASIFSGLRSVFLKDRILYSMR